MNFKKRLEPINTEEVKPGLFVQEMKPDQWRVINPLVWKGKWRLKKQFSFKSLINITIIIFIVWAFMHETSTCQEFYVDFLENPWPYCMQVNWDNFNSSEVINESSITISSNSSTDFRELIPG